MTSPRLRLVSTAQAAPRTTIAVLSGKGGVGKTNIAVNLAICLRARGLDTTLVDLDMGLANADVLLGAQPECDLSDVLARRRSLEETLAASPDGVTFVAGVTGARPTAFNGIERARLGELLDQLPGEVVLYDCAAGLGANVIDFATMADTVLVVTTPEPTAMTDAYAAIKTLFREGYDGSVRVLVNMVETRSEAREVSQRLLDVSQKFLNLTIADAGYVLHDTHVELAVRQRGAFVVKYPRCSASICATAVAARLVGGRAARGRTQTLLRRVVGMFA
jgi:flagellar biosynthesis protein FlhG